MPILDFPRPASTEVCYVRFRTLRADGFVEFDFSIGEPELSVDLILPSSAYEEFCAAHRVRFLTAEQAEQVDAERAKWRFGRPGVHE